LNTIETTTQPEKTRIKIHQQLSQSLKNKNNYKNSKEEDLNIQLVPIINTNTNNNNNSNNNNNNNSNRYKEKELKGGDMIINNNNTEGDDYNNYISYSPNDEPNFNVDLTPIMHKKNIDLDIIEEADETMTNLSKSVSPKVLMSTGKKIRDSKFNSAFNNGDNVRKDLNSADSYGVKAHVCVDDTNTNENENVTNPAYNESLSLEINNLNSENKSTINENTGTGNPLLNSGSENSGNTNPSVNPIIRDRSEDKERIRLLNERLENLKKIKSANLESNNRVLSQTHSKLRDLMNLDLEKEDDINNNSNSNPINNSASKTIQRSNTLNKNFNRKRSEGFPLNNEDSFEPEFHSFSETKFYKKNYPSSEDETATPRDNKINARNKKNNYFSINSAEFIRIEDNFDSEGDSHFISHNDSSKFKDNTGVNLKEKILREIEDDRENKLKHNKKFILIEDNLNFGNFEHPSFRDMKINKNNRDIENTNTISSEASIDLDKNLLSFNLRSEGNYTNTITVTNSNETQNENDFNDPDVENNYTPIQTTTDEKIRNYYYKKIQL
jgi:hypothetical protein